jgi:hypothetical protein
VKFAFIAKHRGIWPAEWLCGALGVTRGGFYAWLTRPRSQRSLSDCRSRFTLDARYPPDRQGPAPLSERPLRHRLGR